MLIPASALVCEHSVDRVGVSDSVIGWFKFLGVMSVPSHFGFDCVSCEKFGLVKIVEEGRHIGVYWV